MGNILNFPRFECRQEMYGGVSTDWDVLSESLADAKKADNFADRAGSTCAALFFCADLPLSAAGDTLTLPYTALLTYWFPYARPFEGEEKGKEEAPPLPAGQPAAQSPTR